MMPQSQVSGSLENLHFNMFTLDRPTCVRNRLSAFEVVQRLSAPAGRCSSALMSRCTLVSRGSSRSLHSSKRAAFAVVLIGLVHVMELFRDLRRCTTPRCPLSGCLSSVACRVRSVRLATARMMSDGSIPVSTGSLLVFVDFRHPVIILQVSFSVASSLFAWLELSHTGQVYSAAELHSARADDLSVFGVAPHFEVLSLWIMLFLVPTLLLVFSICDLYDNLRSSVTPIYTGRLQWVMFTPFQLMLSCLPHSRFRRWKRLTCVFVGFARSWFVV